MSLAQVLSTYPEGAVGVAAKANDVITDIKNSSLIALGDIEALRSKGLTVLNYDSAVMSSSMIASYETESASNMSYANMGSISWDEAATENTRLRNSAQREFASLGDVLFEGLGTALDAQIISKAEYNEARERFALTGGKVPMWGWAAVALVAYVLLA